MNELEQIKEHYSDNQLTLSKELKSKSRHHDQKKNELKKF